MQQRVSLVNVSDVWSKENIFNDYGKVIYASLSIYI